MTPELTVDIFRDSIYLILEMTAPMMISSLLIGLIIAVFQATTQIQEQTLSFVPKIIVIFLVMIMTGPWMLDKVIEFTRIIIESIAIPI